MWNNQGYEIEKAMRKWFRGKSSPLSCVDFQTKTSLYEVKSCRLFTKCHNGNYKRPYKNKPHKKIKTHQFGRFAIKLINHRNLKILADKENKIPKYIFIIVLGKQKIWRVKSWDQINLLIHMEYEFTKIKIKDIFNVV